MELSEIYDFELFEENFPYFVRTLGYFKDEIFEHNLEVLERVYSNLNSTVNELFKSVNFGELMSVEQKINNMPYYVLSYYGNYNSNQLKLYLRTIDNNISTVFGICQLFHLLESTEHPSTFVSDESTDLCLLLARTLLNTEYAYLLKLNSKIDLGTYWFKSSCWKARIEFLKFTIFILKNIHERKNK